MACLPMIPTATCTASAATEHNTKETQSDVNQHEHSTITCGERKLQLFVNSSLGSSFCLQLHPSTTVSALKGLLQDRLGIEATKQHLFTMRNIKLHDANTLEDCGIEQDTNIELRLVAGLMGGAGKRKSSGRRGKEKAGKTPPSQEDVSSQDDSLAENEGQDDIPTSHQPSVAVPSTGSSSRVRSILRNIFRRGRRNRKVTVPKDQDCHEGMAASQQQRLGQEQVDEANRPPWELHQTPANRTKSSSSRVQAALRRVIRKRSRPKDVPNTREQASEQVAMVTEQNLPGGKGPGPCRPPTTEQPSKISEDYNVPCEQHLVDEPVSAVSVQPRSGALQPSSQTVGNIGNISITGDQNSCFCGPMFEPTFNVTVVSPRAGMLAGSSRPDALHFPHSEDRSTRKTQDAALAQAAADQCEGALRSRYMTTGSYVQMIPWVDDDTKHIMDIYTNLQLAGSGKEGKLKSYQDIFLVETREGNVIRRIILNGLAGVGKSTLTDKVSYDWAMKCVSILKKYKLVFSLKMHSLEQSSDLIDSVFEQLLDRDTSIDKHALKSFIDTNPEKVLILLDGFDEFMTTNLNEASFGSILKILNRKECRDCCVVVTTRSSHFNKVVSKCLVQKPFTHVKVLGFTAENIEEYVGKFYSGEPDKAHNLFERIRSSDVLLDLARSPMLLLLMCVLWRDNSSLPDTMFRLYSEALRYIFKRKADVSPEEVARVVKDIGKVGFCGLTSPVQLLSFEERNFEKGVLSTAIRVGLVTSQRVLKGLDTHNSIQFMHKTFQEFCAAMYFQSLFEMDPEEFQKILDQIQSTVRNHPAGFEYLLRFCCGDSEQCASKILHMLQNSCSDSVLKLALVCFFESQSQNFPSPDFISSVFTDAILIEDYNSDCLNSYIWFLRQILDQTEGANLATVEEFMVRRCNLQRFDVGLTYSMRGMTNLSVLQLTACSLTADNMKHIASALGSTAHLAELDLTGNGHLGGTLPSWVSHIQVLKQLKKLKLDDCHLNRKDVQCLAVSVGHMDNLQDCTVQTDVHLRSPKDDLIWPTNPLVCQTNKETSSGPGIRLDMVECSLTGTEMADVVEAMTKRGDLVELILSRNKGLSDSAALWFRPLKQLRHLEHLVLSNCSLKHTDIEHISVSLSNMPTMAKLDLSRNNLGGSTGTWAPHMQVIKHLQNLNLNYCLLTGEDMKHLTRSLSSLITLVKLDLSFNESLGGSAALWAPYLEQMKSLQKLYLRQCALTSEDVQHLTVPLSGMVSCMELNLSGNEQLSGRAVVWSPHLMSMQHLKNLELLGCNINKQDLKYLAKSFGVMPNLVNCSVKSAYLSGRFLVQPTETGIRLDLSQRSLTGKDLAAILEAMSHRNDLVEFILSGNDAVSGSAVLWSPYLKQLKRLERLELHHCSLQRTDIEHISATLRDTRSLTKLDLSLNDTLGGAGKAWSPHLKQIKHLQMLDLSSCALTGGDMKYIAASIADMPKLKELKLSHNDPLGGSASLWSSCLQSLHHLQTLELDECNFKSHEFKYIASSIGCMGNLVNCSVRSNYMGGRFRCLIQPLSSGIQVSLSERSLTGTDLADILEALSTRDDLVELSLVGNDAVTGTASLWSPHLQHLKRLQVVALNRCSLLSSDIEHIATSLSNMPTVLELELSGNKALGGTCATWGQYLRQVKHIQKLHLSFCSLTCDDIKHIAEACSDESMPSLSELDLSCNETLSGSAALWAPYLKQMHHLNKLFLHECLLTGEDMRHIATCMSLNDMANCFY